MNAEPMEGRDAAAHYTVQQTEHDVPPGYKRTEVGVIPEDWVVLPLEAFTSFISYGFTNPMPTSQSGVHLITAKDINHGEIQFGTARHTTEQAYRTLLSTKSRPIKGDLLLTKDGSLGRLALVDDQVICINQSVAIIRPNKRILPSFFKVLLESPTHQKRMLEDAGGSTIKHIYITIVNHMPLAIPLSKTEQRAVAAALSDVDTLITALDKLIAKKRAIKTAAMQRLLTGKQRLPGFSGGWKVRRLGDIAHIKTGGRNNQDKVGDGDYPFFVRSATVERINSYSFDCEAILVPGEGGIGSIFHYLNGRFDVHQRVYAITQFSDDASGKYVYLYMTTNFGAHAMQNSVKATVDSLRLPTFQNFEIVMPPTMAEQTAIATLLSDMDAEITALEARRDKTRAIKQGMMQELLTGKTRLI